MPLVCGSSLPEQVEKPSSSRVTEIHWGKRPLEQEFATSYALSIVSLKCVTHCIRTTDVHVRCVISVALNGEKALTRSRTGHSRNILSDRDNGVGVGLRQFVTCLLLTYRSQFGQP